MPHLVRNFIKRAKLWIKFDAVGRQMKQEYDVDVTYCGAAVSSELQQLGEAIGQHFRLFVLLNQRDVTSLMTSTCDMRFRFSDDWHGIR